MNVNKGSRQIKPVTLGKRLALMIGYQVNPARLSTAWVIVVGLHEVTLGKPFWSLMERGVKAPICILSPLTVSDYIRTVTNKKNPTV